jgi:hypothetical protein
LLNLFCVCGEGTFRVDERLVSDLLMQFGFGLRGWSHGLRLRGLVEGSNASRGTKACCDGLFRGFRKA